VSVGGCSSLCEIWPRVSSGLFSLMFSCGFHVLNVFLDLLYVVGVVSVVSELELSGVPGMILGNGGSPGRREVV
jgi:hypothetical protein